MNILVGYDNSDESKIAIDLAKEHAKAFNAKVFVLHSRVTSLPEDETEQVGKELEDIKKDFDQDGISCETYLEIKNLTPGEHLIKFAEDKKIDEIIMGFVAARIQKFILGSVVNYVLEHAKCRIVIVR